MVDKNNFLDLLRGVKSEIEGLSKLVPRFLRFGTEAKLKLTGYYCRRYGYEIMKRSEKLLEIKSIEEIMLLHELAKDLYEISTVGTSKDPLEYYPASSNDPTHVRKRLNEIAKLMKKNIPEMKAIVKILEEREWK